MALIVADRVLETSTSSGTGNMTLAGGVPGYRALSAVCANGDTFYYYIESVDSNGIPTSIGWETGIGTWNTGNTFSRSLLASSTGSLINWGTETKRVALGITAGAFNAKANVASPTFTGTVTSTDLVITGNTTLGDATTDTLNVGNGGLVKDASGNVGIGVTPSAWNSTWPTLQIKNASFTGTGSLTDLAAMGANLVATGGSYPLDPTVKYISNGYATAYRQYAGAHAWFTAPSGTAGTAITFTQAMTLDASGNLGIGTATPGTNRAFFYGNGGTVVRVGDGTNTNWRGYVIGATSGDSAEYAFLKLNANSGELQLYVGPNSYGGFQTFYTSGSERMRLDSSGNLGIGTSSPGGKLDVEGAFVRFRSGTGYVSFGDNGYIRTDATNILRFQSGSSGYEFRNSANSANLAVLDSSGNLGVGNTPTSWINGFKAIELQGAPIFSNGTNNLTVGTNIDGSTIGGSGAAGNYRATAAAARYQQVTGYHYWYTAPSGTAGTAITWTTAMTLDNAGNLGIGTTTPAYKLQVNGSFAATTKSFVIDHPTKSEMKLRYGSLEGPENGVYIRGRLKDTNKIELPEYWTKLVDPDSITVSLTSIGKHQDLYVADISNNVVTVGNGNILNKATNCFYVVYGERCDVDKLEVEF